MWGIIPLDAASNATTDAINSIVSILPLIISIMIISMVIGIFSYLIRQVKFKA